MYVSVKYHHIAKDCVVLDLDAQKLIDRCIWADDDSGKYCIYAYKDNDYVLETDSLGRELTGINKQIKTVVKKGRIKIIYTKPKCSLEGAIQTPYYLPKGFDSAELKQKLNDQCY